MMKLSKAGARDSILGQLTFRGIVTCEGREGRYASARHEKKSVDFQFRTKSC